MLIAGELIGELQSILGTCQIDQVFGVLTRAIELLANKQSEAGPVWDPLLVYVDLPVQNDYFVFLPDHIEKPIKVTLAGNPAFTRGQMFLYSLNGPGPNDPLLGWQWVDRGQKAIQKFIPANPQALSATSSNVSDNTLSLKARCSFSDGTENWLDVAFNGTPTTQRVKDVLEVVKPVTLGTVTLKAAGYPIASYDPNTTYPWFSLIRLSQRGVAVKMLAKRRTYKITSATDVIPLHSAQAVLLMCDAVKMMREKHYDLAAQAEALALTYLQDAQKSRNQYLLEASQSEMAGARNLSLYNRDSIIVADVYDQAAGLFGPIGETNLYDRITTAVELLANKSQWDPLIGYVDIVTSSAPSLANLYVTLPRYVETVLALNVNGRPADFRSKWFEFHMNGPGSYPRWRGCNTWEDAGTVCTAFELPSAAYLCAIAENPADMESQVVVYGTDDSGLPLVDPDGTEGLTLYATNSHFAGFLDNQKVAYISRIEKDATQGFVRLSTTDGLKEVFSLATYYPDETVPQYQRIRIPEPAAQVRIRYRKRWRKITSLTDPIHLKSRMAIVLMMQAMLESGTDVASSAAKMAMATQLCNEEWQSSNPLETPMVQIDDSIWGGAVFQMF
jgi:hypothetical protein